MGAALVAYLYATTDIPQPEKIAMAATTTVYYSDGKSEIGSFGAQNRQIVSCDDLPSYIGHAVVASENRSFYSDSGIDLKGIARALFTNVTTGSRQGGSTITQQYAERYYLGETTSYSGKLREAILALKIARTQSKETVLCNYLNTIYLGRGSYGIQAAAQAYFGVDAKNLTLSQAALLAGIIPAPSSWDPAQNASEARTRFRRVLNIMIEDGWITASQRARASMPSTVAYRQTNVYSGQKGYLLQMVRSELIAAKAFTADELDTGGYRIVTTIDRTRQALMYEVASPSQGGKGVVPDGLEVGGLSADPSTGAILAVYAGDDYLTHQLNNATQALYEPGSTMKPFALLAAVQSGVSLDTTFNGNSPRRFSGITSAVSNFGKTSYGTISLYKATAYSVNTVYMDLQQKLGASKVAQTAVEAGMSSSRITGKNPFTVLGNDGVHLTDVVRAYSTLASDGLRPTLHIVSAVASRQGKTLYSGSTSSTRVFDANSTALVTKALTGVVQYGTGKEASSIGRTLAGKSGTANDATAASFVGYTTGVVTSFAIWYPDSNGSPREIPSIGSYGSGSGYPIHLFTRYMATALNGTTDTAFPTATDKGTIGGPDGSWGTGRSASSGSSESSGGSSASPTPSASPSVSGSTSTGSASPTTSGSSSSTSGTSSSSPSDSSPSTKTSEPTSPSKSATTQ